MVMFLPDVSSKGSSPCVLKKGDMLGHFAFGGSDFIMIFQDGVSFSLDSPKEEDNDTYQHILMGEQLGILSKQE